MYILKQDEFDLRLGYELEESWSILQKVDLTDNLRVITGDDIQVYNWSSQTITHTQEASVFFFVLSWAENLRKIILKNAFVVTLNEKRFYGGCFDIEGSAMAIDYPVINTDFNSHHVEFILRPSHMPMFKYDQFEPYARQINEVPEVRNLFK